MLITGLIWWAFAIEVFMVSPPGLAVIDIELPLGLLLRLRDGGDVILEGWRRLVQVDGGDGVGRLAGIVDVVRPVQGFVPLGSQVVAGDGQLDVLWQHVSPSFAD